MSRYTALGLVLLCALPISSHAERYRVEQDSFGGYSAKKVEEPTKPAAQPSPESTEKSTSDESVSKRQVSPEQSQVRTEQDQIVAEQERAKNAELASNGVDAEESGNSSVSSALEGVEESQKATNLAGAETPNSDKAGIEAPGKDEALGEESNTQVQQAQPIVSATTSQESGKRTAEEQTAQSNEYIGDIGKTLSPFEREFIENEKRERAKALERIKQGGQAGQYDATAINPAEFVDGDELLKNGGRPTDRSPYYTVVEADGTIRNINFDPDAVQEALDKQRNKKIEFTEANVLERSEPGLALPENADPIAAKLLGGRNTSEDYFSKFSKSCCDNLPNVEINELILGKPFFSEVNEDQLPYRFSDGDSRFLLLKLPQTEAPQALKVRSFIRGHKSHGIEHGVFFPQLVTLSEDRKPMRIFTGPLLKYHAETWLAHGFLEGYFQLDSTESGGEKYLLVNTTKEILRQSSSIEDSEGLITIEHMEIGTIEFELLVEEPKR